MKADRLVRALVAWALLFVFGAVGDRARAGDPPADDPAPSDAESPFAPLRKKKPVAEAVAWRDAKLLAARFTEALDAVERETGRKFERRPRLRISTADEVKRVLVAEVASLGGSFGKHPEAALGVVVKSLAAKYDLASHVVHVIPDNVDGFGALFGAEAPTSEGALRVILAHECVHALDFPRLGWQAKRALRPTEEEQKAFGAVVEGHAQLVASRIAAAWGLEAEFARFTRVITAIPAGLDSMETMVARILTAEAEFAYGKGREFLEAVLAARGPAGLEAVLADPPRTTRVIERPSEYLVPRTDFRLPLAPIVDVLDALAPAPAWTHGSQGVLEVTIRSLLADLPEADRAGALAGFEEARVHAASNAKDGAVATAVAIRFATPAQATAWLGIERKIAERKDATMTTGSIRITAAAYEAGAGPGAAIDGFVAVKDAMVGTVAMRVVSHIFAAGPVAFELIFSRVTSIDRYRQDAAVAAMAAYVTDPAHPVPAVPPSAAAPADDAPPKAPPEKGMDAAR